MTATDELRRMLDKRGVEYDKAEDDTTIYYDSDGNRYTYNVNRDSGWAQLFGYHVTPEQAIAATLGESDEGCYLMRDGKKFPVELDYGFLGILPISIKVAGFRYLLEVPNGE